MKKYGDKNLFIQKKTVFSMIPVGDLRHENLQGRFLGNKVEKRD